jgi:hypothetical protein
VIRSVFALIGVAVGGSLTLWPAARHAVARPSSAPEAAGCIDPHGLMRAPPLVGRGTADAIEWNLLTAERPVAVALTLESEAATGAESEAAGASGASGGVAFAPLVAESVPAVRWRSTGALAAGGSPSTRLVLPPLATVELRVAGLPPGASGRFRIDFEEAEPGERSTAAVARGSASGRFVTARPRGAPFTFLVFSDTHVFPARIEPEIPAEAAPEPAFLEAAMESVFWYRTTRERVAAEFELVFEQMNRERPDFAVSLGDVFDLHGRAFNWAFTSQELADAAHLDARRAVSLLHDCGTLYQALGNWEAESGCHPEAQRGFARDARLRHANNPRPDTSPLGGSSVEDYFAFEWGDLLGIVLNVRGYTPTAHHMDPAEPASGRPDDFTLGAAQKEFLSGVLSRFDAPHKALFLHHVVGGNAGNPWDSSYGRGGGRAAKVGEQAWVHDLCARHGANVIFYGHDHVFTEMEVDGVRYALPGTTSAPWRFSREETGYEKFWTESGYARVKVAPAAMDVEFVSLGGEVLHAFTVPAARSGR